MQHIKPESLVPARLSRWSVVIAMAAMTPWAAAQSASDPTSTPKSDDVIQLSPFQVTDSQDKGYQATSAMSGTRLNTKLEDLAASLSVVTKQQIEDTASIDINDIFKYELSTEGTSQWTNFNVDRGVVTDGVQSDPNGSTRMRGLTAANIALNGFNVHLPVDTYDIESIEISRGPNSTVFGLGNTGGGINIIKGHANTSRDVTRFTVRGDSYGGYRGNFGLNRVVIPNKLAVAAYGVYDDKGFERKPSEDVTRRLEGAVTFRPFRNTSIYASFESYRNRNSRPNALTPTDTITDWISSGRPTWDPITQTVHLADGTSIADVTTGNESKLLPYGLAVSSSSFQNAPSAYYNQDGSLGLFMISRMPGTALKDGGGPNNAKGTLRLMQNGLRYFNNPKFPLFNSPQITDKSIYDWTSINLAAPNYQAVRGETSQIQLEQIILNTERQSLALQAAWLNERISTHNRRFLGTGGASLQPYVDVNEKLLDGSPNPYFLRTYVGGAEPSTSLARNNTENYRATLAYQLDLSREKNWLHWLGVNRFMGFAEYSANEGGSLGFQDVIAGNPAWLGTPNSRKNTGLMVYPRYYVGDTSGQNIDYAPARTASTPYTVPLKYYNVADNQWETEATTYDLFYDAGRYSKRLLSTQGAVWQGYFLDGRIIPLLGVRKDYNRSREANNAINPTAATNGYYDMSPVFDYGTNDWVQQHGRTDNEGIVVKPLRWLDLTYNQANSFNPGSAVYNVWGEPLPNPRGKSKDYGFSIHLLDNRLVITAKQYETVDIGRSTSDLNTIVQRAIRMDRRSSSGDPQLTDWYIGQLQQIHPDWDQTRLVAETLKATGADYDYLRSHINKTHGDASNSYSRGKEVEITFNPDRFWRMKLTASQETPINGTMSPAVQDYINARMPIWTTIKDPVTGDPWWTSRESINSTIPRDWYTNNVLANLKLAVALQGKRRSQTREYHVSYLTSYALAGITENRWLKPLDVGGSVRWESKASIGYLGATPDPDGVVREYDPNQPVWQKGNTYVDLFTKYRLRFFHDKVQCTLQLNVNNVFESGHLQPVAVNPDGSPWAFRIVDPRQFILSASFDL
jgi:outer membrane receptor protein involved in Fe transport